MLRTDCGNGGDNLSKLQLVKNGGLSGSVETDHQNSHLLLAPQAVEQLGEGKTHIGGGLRCEVGRCVEGGRKGPSLVSCAAREARSAHVLRGVCAWFARAPLIEESEVNTPACAGVAYVSPRQARSLFARHADALDVGVRRVDIGCGQRARLTC